MHETYQPAFLTTIRSETVQGYGMTGFRDRGARRHSLLYVERSDRGKASQGVPLGRRTTAWMQELERRRKPKPSRRVVRNAG